MTGMVIVGGGKAGARAAVALRENHYDGPITMITGEDYAPYDRPPLSKSIITDIESPKPPYLTDEATLRSINVTLIKSNSAQSIDRSSKTIKLANGATYGYDKLLLATGAMPRRLSIAGANSGRVRYLRDFEDALALRENISTGKHIIIIGAGFIGLEVAASARKRGATVTVLEGAHRVLSRGVPEEIAAVVSNRHRAEGVDIQCGAGLIGFEEREDKIAAVAADGRKIVGDFVLVGIGAVPVTELAQRAELVCENGICVDANLQTSDPHIYAAGDCVSFPLSIYGGRRVRLESWRNAQDQGALAAVNMLGKAQALATVPWFWSDQYDLTLQITGLADEGSKIVRRSLNEGSFILFYIAQDGRLVAASGIGKGNLVAKDIRLAEMMIGMGIKPDPNQLTEATVNLKQMLAR